MILKSFTVECNDCSSLKTMIEKIDCSLYNLIKNKHNNERFNTEECFSIEQFKDLSHYKRIITKRIFSPKYPCDTYTNQDIISGAVRKLFGDWECSKCVNCDYPDVPFLDVPIDELETTSTSSTTTSTTTTTII